MKGHLGFRCVPCAVPAAPVAIPEYRGNELEQGFYWTEPSSSRPITHYVIQKLAPWAAPVTYIRPGVGVSGGAVPKNQWTWLTIYSNWTGSRSFFDSWCRTHYEYRVAAVSQCGQGPWSNVVVPGNDVYSTFYWPSATILTSGTSLADANLCTSRYLTAYCIGAGSVKPSGSQVGGNGGGIAWRTWDLDTVSDFANAYSIGSVKTSFTFDGLEIWADAATTSAPGGYNSSAGFSQVSGAGGSYGGGGYTSSPPQFENFFMYGGSIGGGVSPPALVTPCRRMPAADQNNLMASVALAGGKVTEDCSTQAAFGSGASRFPYAGYGGSAIEYTAGYGGGGFDSNNPPGPGAIVLYFHR